ncbi:unnamed protein product, partial [Symbiodinium sp. KB8]
RLGALASRWQPAFAARANWGSTAALGRPAGRPVPAHPRGKAPPTGACCSFCADGSASFPHPVAPSAGRRESVSFWQSKNPVATDPSQSWDFAPPLFPVAPPMGRTPSPIAWRQLWAARAVLVAALAALLLASQVIDPALQLAWTWLREQPWYNSPFFETLQVPVVSFALYLGFNAVAAAWPEFDMRDESDQRAHGALAHQGRAVKEASWDFFSYVLPLLVLDTCTRKFYPGWVSRADWQSEPYFGWQTTRLLPEAGPTVFDLLFKPVAALLFYDAVFYFLHNAFHRVSALKGVHSVHHEHVKLSWTTTNQLTVVER